MDKMLDNFCPVCGCILNKDTPDKVIKCVRKNCTFTKERIGNDLDKFSCKVTFAKKAKKVDDMSSVMSGPQIEYQCPACKYHLATYFTRQMRSADEGQTVFYVCLKCKQVTREE